MRLPPFLSSLSSRSSSQRVPTRVTLPTHVLDDDSDDDQDHSLNPDSVPLTADSSYPPSSSSTSSRHKRSPSSASPFTFTSFLSRLPVRRILATLVVLTALYKLHRYTSTSTTVYDKLQSHLDVYSQKYNPWHPQPVPTVYVQTQQSVQVRGRRYRAAKERKDDRYWGWKGLPYGKNPEGERRFRVSEWLDEAGEGKEKERVMDTWDEGCVRPRGRSDGKDGPKPDFDGHEDCLKCVRVSHSLSSVSPSQGSRWQSLVRDEN